VDADSFTDYVQYGAYFSFSEVQIVGNCLGNQSVEGELIRHGPGPDSTTLYVDGSALLSTIIERESLLE